MVTCLGFIKKSRKKTIRFFFFCYYYYYLDLLVSISLKKPFCWGPQIHTRHNMSTVEIQCSLILFITKEKLWIVVFGFAFFFFQEGADARELFLYIFYNTLWLLKIKICGKRVCVKVLTRPDHSNEGLLSVSWRRFVWESVPDFKPYCP